MEFDPHAVMGAHELCTSCGYENPPAATACAQCGAELSDEDEDAVEKLDVVSSEGAPNVKQFRVKKAALEASPNWILIHEAAAGALDGTLSRDEFRVKIDEAKKNAEIGVELFKTDVLKSKIATLPPEQAALANQTAAETARVLEGRLQMRQFVTQGTLDDVQQGLATAEAAFHALDRIREKAFEIANAEIANS